MLFQFFEIIISCADNHLIIFLTGVNITAILVRENLSCGTFEV